MGEGDTGDRPAGDENETEALRRQHRERMDRIDAWVYRLSDTVRHVALAAPLAVALVVLTATSWQITRSGRGRNAWEVADAVGWPAGITLALVLLLALGTLLAALARVPSPGACQAVATVAVVTAFAVFVVAALTESPAKPTAGLWLTALASATLFVQHVHRARMLNRAREATASR